MGKIFNVSADCKSELHAAAFSHEVLDVIEGQEGVSQYGVPHYQKKWGSLDLNS